MNDAEARVTRFREDFERVEAEVAKFIVGQQPVIRGVLTALFAGGNCLLEGVPGLGKTALVRTLAQALSLEFRRIQFTPDLMPADIVGTNLVSETPDGQKVFRFQPGPIFGQIILADEINRATPKTQSALLEAMQEHRVTVGETTYTLKEPFFVLATQNPIEMEGTYPLPEAQLDRFMFKLIVRYSSLDELSRILERTTDAVRIEIRPVLDGARILQMQALVREVISAPHVKDYATRLVWATHPESELAPERVRRFVRYGASPRGAQALILAGKVRALTEGRFNVSYEDIRVAAHNALRHRILLNFEGEAEGIRTDDVITEILESVQPEVEAARK